MASVLNTVGDCLIALLDLETWDEAGAQADIVQLVHQQSLRTVLIDLSNASVVDDYQADEIVALARTVSVLGASTILFGIQPGVAAALAALSHEITNLTACVTIEDALQRSGRQIVANGRKSVSPSLRNGEAST